VSGPPDPPDPVTGGTGPGPAAGAARRPIAALTGSVLPARRGARVAIERLAGGRWVGIGATRIGRGGRYHAPVTRKGVYRIRFGGAAGPAVRID
jgi:hypothetical protein